MRNLYCVRTPLAEVKTSFDAKVTQTGLPLAIRIIEAILKPLSKSERSVKTIRESVPEWQNAFSDYRDNEGREMTVLRRAVSVDVPATVVVDRPSIGEHSDDLPCLVQGLVGFQPRPVFRETGIGLFLLLQTFLDS